MTRAQRNAYDLGRAVGRYDGPWPGKLTPGCLGNVSDAPHVAPALLRHVWPEMTADPEISAILAAVDFTAMPLDASKTTYFFLGFYHAKGGRFEPAAAQA